jgi:hypothetical protein
VDVDFNDPFDDGKFTLNGQVNEPGNDGIVGWGRWTGDVTQALNLCEGPCGSPVVETYNPDQGLHYVIGTPTASMPLTGTASYNLLGATKPTYLTGGLGTLTSLGLSVDFGRLTVGMDLRVAMSDGNGWQVGGNAQISANTFSGSFDPFGGGNLTVTGTGGSACGGASSCGALVEGFFAGASAERAGLVYHIQDSSVGKDVLGAAAFTKQ